MLCDVTYENIAYTGLDLDGRSLTDEQLLVLNREMASAPNRPVTLVDIQGFSLSEDDDQEEEDRKLFVSVVLRLAISCESAATAQPPPEDFLTAVVERFNTFENLSIHAEEMWEVMESEMV